jgi:hypothetical protein
MRDWCSLRWSMGACQRRILLFLGDRYLVCHFGDDIVKNVRGQCDAFRDIAAFVRLGHSIGIQSSYRLLSALAPALALAIIKHTWCFARSVTTALGSCVSTLTTTSMQDRRRELGGSARLRGQDIKRSPERWRLKQALSNMVAITIFYVKEAFGHRHVHYV